MKHYLHRAQKFRDERSHTIEEKVAWQAVVEWFESILARKRIDSRDVIVLNPVPIEALEKEFESMIVGSTMTQQIKQAYNYVRGLYRKYFNRCETCGAPVMKPREDGRLRVGTYTNKGEIREVRLCENCLNMLSGSGNEFRPNKK